MATDYEPRLTHRYLQAAHFVAQLVPDAGCLETTLRAGYPKLGTGALQSPASLREGQRTLEEAHLLVRSGSDLRPSDELLALRLLPLDAFVEALLLRRLTASPGLWLAGLATQDSVPWELVPKDVATTLASTFAEQGAREAFVLNAASKVDQEALDAFGALGEVAVVASCRSYLIEHGAAYLAEDVARVSLYDDTLGYDIISPDLAGSRHRMEVKATSALPGWVEFFISRNEATVAARDPAWSLVVTRREPDPSGELVMRVVGWLEFAQFRHLLPIDAPIAVSPGASGRWAAGRVTLPDYLLHDGLPLDSRS